MGGGTLAQVWAISTNKGGVLKTSITTNLAGVLCRDHRVLIIDTDNQGNAALSFGLNPDDFYKTIYDVLLQEAKADDLVINVHKNIDLLASNDDMSFLEFEVLTRRRKYQMPFHLLKDNVGHLTRHYDYILIDTPPNLGLIQGNVLTFADQVLIPFQPEHYSMRSLTKILKSINDFKERHNHKLEILGVVATLVDQRTNLHSVVLQECKKYCYHNEITMFDTVIPRSVRFASSIAYEGLPATLTQKNNRLVSSYFELIKEVKENGKTKK